MAGPEGGGPEGQDDLEATPPPLPKEQIEGHLSVLKSIIKDHNRRNKTNPIRLDFVEEDTEARDNRIVKGKEVDVSTNTLDGPPRGWFERLPANNINEWSDLKEAFAARYSADGGNWVYHGSAGGHEDLIIHGLTQKPRFGEAFLGQGPNDWNEMMRRGGDNRAPYPPPRGDYQARVAPVLTLDVLTKPQKEILATETLLRLAPPRTMLNPMNGGNMDRYCDYHQEKGHHMNDYHQLRKQLETAPESGKLNHQIRDSGNKSQAEGDSNLVGFAGEATKPLGKIELEVCFRSEGLRRRTTMKFIVIRAPSPYNIILGRTGLRTLRAIPSTIHSMMKFPTLKGVATLVTRSVIISECRRLEKKQVVEEEEKKEEIETKAINITESQLKLLLKNNMDIFSWEPADMTGVPRRIIEYNLNVNTSVEPVCQKQRVLAPEKSSAVAKDVDEWVKAGIVRPVKYPTKNSNLVLVKKCDGAWRMCIDFKNMNSTCPKDYYPLPNIDCKVESVMGFKYKCFVDAYKGNHQIQMSKEDEEKTTFYTNQGTYCYTKMPFGLKNVGA
ncbi:hypothetical protein Tco_0391133 [Tanacetum coccineum]